jgi:hypothetical protein
VRFHGTFVFDAAGGELEDAVTVAAHNGLCLRRASRCRKP